jgi:3-dehydroquinate synthase
MIRVKVLTPPRPYEALIEGGLLRSAGMLLREIYEPNRKLCVITNASVRRRWGRELLKSLTTSGFSAKVIELPEGERHKQLGTVESVAEKLASLCADRSSVILAFGGGVVGDVAGLVASLYMRGVDVVQLPTTVVAQADAAIGGKTGVNLRAGKNLLGTFHQPKMVLIDPDVLSTLPEREFSSGIYEVLKCGVIGNVELFQKLEHVTAKELRDDAQLLEWAIAQSVKLKAEIVSQDERESGLRRVLNFGHTIGHALEAESGYRRFLHGEAVAWGMIAAAEVSARTGRCEHGIASRIRQRMLSFATLPEITAKSRDLLRLLRSDKKTHNGVVHFVLPMRIGNVEIVGDVPEALILEALNELRSLPKRS